MVRRDPQTGKFVSGGGEHSWAETNQITGAISYSIPAADLSGGTGTTASTEHQSEIVDFTNMLDNDEVFLLDAMQVVATFYLPTTATAEGSGALSYAIGPESGAVGSVLHTSPFYHGSADRSDGTVDINQEMKEGENVLHVGQLNGEPSLADTTNGLAGGAAYAHDREFISFRKDIGAQPAFDADDELYCPIEFSYDNISDHAIGGTVKVLLHGRVEELD